MTVVLDTDRVSLLQAETLATLRSFSSKSFDIVVTDPPYSEHVHEKFGKERRNDGQKVPDELTFPPMTEALIFAVAQQLVRTTKGWIIICSDFYNSHKWGQAVVANGGAWVRTGQWVKTNPKPQMTADRPACGAEDIVICHAQPDTLEGRRHWEWNGGGHAATWRGRRDPGYGETPHPNQKPLWLMQALLGMFAPPGAICLEPYFGSGTTALAALMTERAEGESAAETACPKCAKKILEQYQPPLPQNVSVVGIEGDPRFVDLSIARIRETYGALLAA